MAAARLHYRTRDHAVATAVLLAVFLTINALAVWGIFSGRQDARRAAENELVQRTRLDARALEAALATLRGDFLLISKSPPLASFPGSLSEDDPMRRRWSRLDAESTLLLFLDAHPAVERLEVRDGGDRPLIAAGRRRGMPELLPAETASPPPGAKLFVATFGLSPAGGELVAWLDPQSLLAISSPRHVDRLRVDRDDESRPPSPGELSAQTPVTDESWEPPIAWWLVRREQENELLASVENLAERYRTTVVLNLTVMTLTLVLGALALRQVRRAARLEAENRQEKRVRELERQLMHSERLASVGRLAAGLAHEINNPLEGMGNYLALLSEDLSEGRVHDASKLVARIREGLDRTAGITRQVLVFSRPGRERPGRERPGQARPGQAPKAAVDLVRVLDDAAGFVRSSRDHRQVEIRLELADGLPRPLGGGGGELPRPLGGRGGQLQVCGNPITLGQLFLNLLLNACQAQPEGGEVEVRAAAGDAVAVVTVADRGPGLGEEVLGHLFEPFYSTRDSTGLGLAVCHGIVTDHGGEIEGRNRPGGGALFEVRLPLLSPPQHLSSPLPLGEGRGKGSP
jgi:signal transduction histidine kinase